MTPSKITDWNAKHPVGSFVWLAFQHEIKSPATDTIGYGMYHCNSHQGGFLVAEKKAGTDEVEFSATILDHDPRLADQRIKELEVACKELQEKVWELGEQLSQSYTREQMVEIFARGMQDRVPCRTIDSITEEANRILDAIKRKEV